jgi:hypothetical protein
MKNIPFSLRFSIEGPLSTSTKSNDLTKMSGQDSDEDSQNSVKMPNPMLSKFSGQGCHLPPAF